MVFVYSGLYLLAILGLPKLGSALHDPHKAVGTPGAQKAF